MARYFSAIDFFDDPDAMIGVNDLFTDCEFHRMKAEGTVTTEELKKPKTSHFILGVVKERVNLKLVMNPVYA